MNQKSRRVDIAFRAMCISNKRLVHILRPVLTNSTSYHNAVLAMLLAFASLPNNRINKYFVRAGNQACILLLVKGEVVKIMELLLLLPP